MKHQRWHHARISGCLFILLLAVLAALGPPMAKGGVNPLLEEMAALDSTFKTIIGAVILEDLDTINPALKKVRDAREGMEAALKGGYRIQLPKNQNRLGDFFKLDTQFHIELEELSAAAATGQKRVVRNLAHKLLDQCVGCHERFRK